MLCVAARFGNRHGTSDRQQAVRDRRPHETAGVIDGDFTLSRFCRPLNAFALAVTTLQARDLLLEVLIQLRFRDRPRL